MDESKQKTISYQEYKSFLSYSYASKEEFEREYRKLYYGKTKASELYIQILAELERAISVGNLDSFKNLSIIIGYINDVENQESLKAYHGNTDNPIVNTNLVILACKYNQEKILKNIINNSEILDNISIGTGKVAITPDDEDGTCHNAFYYAIRSNNIELLSTLINNWPDKYFAVHLEELEDILSKAYEELILKNVPLSDEVKIFVENRLINLRFFSKSSGQKQNVKTSLGNIRKRIELVVENISLLKTQYSNVEVDEKFLFVAKFIAQNIHVLKRQLKSTYNILPWEEMEFCLIAFIRSKISCQEINLIYHSILPKDKILLHLDNFATKLEKIKINEAEVNSNLPTLKREKAIINIVSNYPLFKELYDDYKEVKDIYSLDKIAKYIELALTANPEENNDRLVIARVLQVTGEYLKNTLESPNISDNIKDILLSSGLQKSTREVINSFRNVLSHFYSLKKRIEIEESEESIYFSNVKNDLNKIKIEITDLREISKAKAIRTFLKKIIESEDLKAAKKLGDIFINILPDLKEIKLENLIDTKEFIKLKGLIDELDEEIIDKTLYEIKLFHKIRKIIDLEETKLKDSQKNYASQIFNIGILCDCAKDSMIMKRSRMKYLNIINFESKKQFKFSKVILQLINKICDSTKERKHCSKFDQIMNLINKISYTIGSEIGEIKGIETLRNRITEDNEEGSPIEKKVKDTRAKDCLNKRLNTLRDVLSANELLSDSNLIEKFPCYKKNKKLQLIVEMLVLDIAEVLQHLGYLGNNYLFLDKYSPLLIGRCLRNHLAHGNALINILQFDTSITVISNALKLVKEENNLVTKIIGQSILDNHSCLRDHYTCNLNILINQQEMFEAAMKGDLDRIKDYISKGADVMARDINQWTLLHVTAAGGSLEATKFFLNYNLDINAKNNEDQKPLHIAAFYGKTDIVEFFIKEKGLCVNDLGNDRKTPMHIAVENGHKDIVKFLLKHNSNVEAKDIINLRPLHYAARYGHQDIVMLFLLNKRITVNSIAGDGWTPLHFASQIGNVEIVKILLKKKANINAKTNQCDTPLSCAAQEGHIEIVKILLAHGANINHQSIYGQSPLYYAVWRGNLEVVKTLLANKANVNILNINNETPLHLATRHGHLDIVNVLLMNRSKVNAIGNNNVTALQLAVEHGYEEIVKALLKKGAKVNDPDNNKWTPLHNAAYDDRLDIVNTLLANGANASAKTGEDSTPLHLAAGNGHLEIVKVLIKKTDINIKANSGTPLQCAAEGGHLDTVDLLLTNGANVNAMDDDKWTPLRVAVQGGHLETIKVLLANGANVNAMDNEKCNPLLLAVQLGYVKIVEVLLSGGGNINVLSQHNLTPLHLAASKGDEYIVETLLNHGAGINAKTQHNTTPLYSAIKEGHVKVVKALLERGAKISFDKDEKNNLLFLAVANGYKEITEILLQIDKTIINSKTEDGWTALHIAAGGNKSGIIDVLLKNKANVNARDNTNHTPLLLAVRLGHIKMVEALLAGGANVNVLGKIIEKDNTCITITPLHCAVGKCNKEIVEILLKNGANVDIKIDDGRTPLCFAAREGHEDIVKTLLRTGANVNIVDNYNQTSLLLAAANGYERIVKILLNYKAKIDTRAKDGGTTLHQAAFHGYENIIEILLNEGAKIDDIDEGLWTPLHCAVQQGQEKATKFLLSKGANVNFEDKDGRIPLHWSAQKGYEKIIEILLQNKANVNAIDHELGMTPLHFASTNGHLKAIDALLNAKNININSIDFNHRAPIHYATYFGNKEVVKALLQKGAYFDIKCYDNSTPLQIAIKTGHSEITALLKLIQKLFNAIKENNYLEVKSCIHKEVLVNCRSIECEDATPLFYALSKEHIDIVDILLKNNVNVNCTNRESCVPLHVAAKNGLLEIVKSLLKHGASYNIENNEGKTPHDVSKDQNITKLLKLLEELFEDAKNGNVKIISKLRAVKPDELLAVTNTRNNLGKTLLQVAITNKHKTIASEILKMLK